MLFSITSARAQCPDDVWGPPPSSVLYPWTSGYSYTTTIPGTSCEIEIQYCMRNIPGGIQIFITSVIPTDPILCDGISNATLVRQARNLIYNDGQVNREVPCYKGAPSVVQVYTSQCWKSETIPGPEQGAYGLYPCVGFELCKKTCYICYDHGIHISGCTVDYPATSQVCPPPPGTWETSVCYTLGCDD
jgi:hypothetical protein